MVSCSLLAVAGVGALRATKIELICIPGPLATNRSPHYEAAGRAGAEFQQPTNRTKPG